MNLRGEDGKVRKKYILTGFLSLILIIAVSSAIYFAYIFSRLERTVLPDDDVDLGITVDNNIIYEVEDGVLTLRKGAWDFKVPPPVNVLRRDEVVNIALFGLDSRKPGYWSRSDTIMIVSLDMKSKTIKATSFMRDIYLTIPGRGKDKINAAYAYGGPELAIKTLNSNFGLNIRDYVTVDFFGLEKLINSVGGLDINVKGYELENINKYIDEVNELRGEAPGNYNLVKAGLQRLNGRQAVSYGRIRYVGNGDYERTERQRKIIELLFQKIKERGVLKLPATVSSLLPYVNTSLTNEEIIKLGGETMNFEANTLESARVPFDGLYESGGIDGTYAIQLNMEESVKKLYEFVYGKVEQTTGDK